MSKRIRNTMNLASETLDLESMNKRPRIHNDEEECEDVAFLLLQQLPRLHGIVSDIWNNFCDYADQKSLLNLRTVNREMSSIVFRGRYSLYFILGTYKEFTYKKHRPFKSLFKLPDNFYEALNHLERYRDNISNHYFEERVYEWTKGIALSQSITVIPLINAQLQNLFAPYMIWTTGSTNEEDLKQFLDIVEKNKHGPDLAKLCISMLKYPSTRPSVTNMFTHTEVIQLLELGQNQTKLKDYYWPVAITCCKLMKTRIARRIAKAIARNEMITSNEELMKEVVKNDLSFTIASPKIQESLAKFSFQHYSKYYNPSLLIRKLDTELDNIADDLRDNKEFFRFLISKFGKYQQWEDEEEDHSYEHGLYSMVFLQFASDTLRKDPEFTTEMIISHADNCRYINVELLENRDWVLTNVYAIRGIFSIEKFSDELKQDKEIVIKMTGDGNGSDLVNAHPSLWQNKKLLIHCIENGLELDQAKDIVEHIGDLLYETEVVYTAFLQTIYRPMKVKIVEKAEYYDADYEEPIGKSMKTHLDKLMGVFFKGMETSQAVALVIKYPDTLPLFEGYTCYAEIVEELLKVDRCHWRRVPIHKRQAVLDKMKQ